jgi:hypothetical protein
MLDQIGGELSRQIQSARSRRTILAKQYETATGANRAGLEQQLGILDQRIAQLELDIAQVGVEKAQIPQTFTGAQSARFDFGPIVGGSGGILFLLLAVFALLPVSFGVGRWFWRRSSRPAVPPGWSDAASRLERVEQALETIAIEVERVSEGQRFMSKIMAAQSSEAASANGASEDAAARNGAMPLRALGAGSPEPIVIPQREEVRVKRS